MRQARSTPLASTLALLALLAAAPGRADELRPLRWDPALDPALTAGAAGLLLLGAVLREPLGPAACRDCAPGHFDAEARIALVWPFPATARSASGALAVALVVGAGAEAWLEARAHGDPGSGLVDLLVMAQAVTVALDAGLLLQHATGRQRPAVRYGDDPGSVHQPGVDDNLSFPAGQATLAFSVAAAAGTVAFMRGSRLAPWVLGIGLGLASVIGYLRIAGDMNYATDVLAGAALGGATGFALPWLLHRPEQGPPAAVRLVPAPGGLALVF